MRISSNAQRSNRFAEQLFRSALKRVHANNIDITTIKTMKSLRFVSVLFALLAISSKAFAAFSAPVEVVRSLSYHPAIRGSSDQMEVRSIHLVNGIYEKGRKYVDQDYECLRAGQVAFGDINCDGKTDAVVVLYHLRGDRQLTQIAIVLDVNGTPVHAASRELGENTEVMDLKCARSFIQVGKNGQMAYRGVVSVELSKETCCNGQGKTVTYVFEGKRLIGPDPFNR